MMEEDLILSKQTRCIFLFVGVFYQRAGFMFNKPIFYTVSSADKEPKSAAKTTSPIIALNILLHEGNYLSIPI